LTADRTQGFDVGADQYLMKPFDLDELLSRVKSMLAMYSRRVDGRPTKPATAAGNFEFGEAKINFDTFEVTVAGKPIRLTHLEMKLLQYFADCARRSSRTRPSPGTFSRFATRVIGSWHSAPMSECGLAHDAIARTERA
jgi:DNA-binding response OmpR family regulator